MQSALVSPFLVVPSIILYKYLIACFRIVVFPSNLVDNKTKSKIDK